jgi:anti-sigma-K factor RskA
MYDDDRDALAAEYVLGTLSADEREQAEALIAIDPGFAEVVRVWERRLGELNVMVEAVEPPPQVWDKIKVETVDRAPEPQLTAEEEFAFPPIEETAPQTAPELAAEAPPATAAAPPAAPAPQPQQEPPKPQEVPKAQEVPKPQEVPKAEELQEAMVADEEVISPAASQSLEDLLGEPPPDAPQDLDDQLLASSLLPAEAEPAKAPAAAETPGLVDEPDFEADLKAVVLQDLREHGKDTGRGPTPEPFTPLKPPQPERSADVIVLARRVRRWRGFTVAMSAIAALLAVYVAVSQFAPGLVPVSRQAPPPAVTAQVAPPPQPSRLVAVLQQDPTTPAFLVSIDPTSRTLTVRRVSAAAEPNRSYELWLISNKFPAPRSLGVVGASEFTSRPLPAGFDADTIKTASYAISLEPAGGSTTGAPSGPILFKGRMVESLPGSAG